MLVSSGAEGLRSQNQPITLNSGFLKNGNLEELDQYVNQADLIP